MIFAQGPKLKPGENYAGHAPEQNQILECGLCSGSDNESDYYEDDEDEFCTKKVRIELVYPEQLSTYIKKESGLVPAEMCVKKLKQKIEKKEGIPIEFISISLDGNKLPLDDGDLLEQHCGGKNVLTLHVNVINCVRVDLFGKKVKYMGCQDNTTVEELKGQFKKSDVYDKCADPDATFENSDKLVLLYMKPESSFKLLLLNQDKVFSYVKEADVLYLEFQMKEYEYKKEEYDENGNELCLINFEVRDKKLSLDMMYAAHCFQ